MDYHVGVLRLVHTVEASHGIVDRLARSSTASDAVGAARVFGACRALRAYDLKRCRVYALAVSGSAHVENIVDSVFCVAARQLRAHCARRTRFHARVASRPVVEDSRDVAFAPRVALEDAHASADDELLRKHGLDVENGLWREVDDFLWLRASQSPHWRELEEDARDADARDVRARAARAREGL